MIKSDMALIDLKNGPKSNSFKDCTFGKNINIFDQESTIYYIDNVVVYRD
jgi:hypothetical protein